MEGVLYCNDGDWVDSCSALVETRGGEIELWHWTEADRELPQQQRSRSIAHAA